MSRAIVCDGCGKVRTEIGEAVISMHAIWVRNPFMVDDEGRDDIASLHLCDECYARFEDEYLANLKECS